MASDWKVLLVDDEERIRSGIKKLLEQIIGGFKVVYEAENGNDAFCALSEYAIDLIITDIRMSELDGLELIRRVRKQWPDMPILVISGYDEYEYMRHSLKHNVNDYLLKPIDRVEFAETLQNIKQILRNRKGLASEPQNSDMQNGNDSSIIRYVKKLIYERIAEDISLQCIAEEVKYSYTHLSALFKKETGQAFSNYLIAIRMEKAKQLLRETTLKVYEVGALCGYPNEKYFMSIFKKTCKMTPSEYRDSFS